MGFGPPISSIKTPCQLWSRQNVQTTPRFADLLSGRCWTMQHSQGVHGRFDDIRRAFEEAENTLPVVTRMTLFPNSCNRIANLNVDEFWQRVETNLRAARVRLLFVADDIPDELDAHVVEFLNEQMPGIEVLAVEIKQFLGETGKDAGSASYRSDCRHPRQVVAQVAGPES